MLTMADPLEHARRLHAGRTAIFDGDERFDYATFVHRCARLAAGLDALGVERGDRVAILAANGHRYLEAFFGIPAWGGVVVPLNTRLAVPELEAILRDSAPRVLLTDRDPGPLARCVKHVVRMPVEYEKLLQAQPRPHAQGIGERTLAALFYTGGTSGRPKGVMLTHRNIYLHALSVCIEFHTATEATEPVW